jgi:ferritin-like metal-binding protein YciE
MKGLIAEGEEMLDRDGNPSVRDAGLIAAAQRVEHYEISGYGTARQFASQLGDAEAARLLEATLHEESSADQQLNRIALEEINVTAPLAH